MDNNLFKWIGLLIAIGVLIFDFFKKRKSASKTVGQEKLLQKALELTLSKQKKQPIEKKQERKRKVAIGEESFMAQPIITETVTPIARRAVHRRLLQDKNAMRQALICKEILGPPKALQRSFPDER